MKRVFVFLSTMIIMFFFLLKINQSSDEFLFDLTNNVTLEQGSNTISKEDLSQSLKQYAHEHQSLIVKRIIVPAGHGESSYVYQKFGKGKLTQGLKEASTYEQNTSSEISQYRVISGSLTNQQLGDYFRKMGYKVDVSPKRPVLFVAGSYLSSSSISLSLIVFILTFAALTVILRIKDLRSAGIRLISGESIGSIVASSVKSDAVVITLAFLLSNGIGLLLFLAKGWLQLPYWQLLLVGLFCYDFLLLLISFLLSLVYFVGLRKNDLLGVIKGKLPLNRVIGIMAFCQLLAIMIVGISISRIPIYYSELLEEQRAANEWHKLGQRVNLVTGLATEAGNKNEAVDWYRLQSEAIEISDAILAKNNFTNFPNGMKDPNGLTAESYDPGGNTLYVTPNYLKYEHIKLSAKSCAKMNHLKLGEYGLILPEKLKADTKKYQKLYDQRLANFTDQKVKVSPIVTYVSNEKERFAYNNIAVSPQQFVKDPIIVVLTPKSTGDNLNSWRFWKSTGVYYTFYRGFDQTKKLLKKHHLYEKIAEISDSQQNYEREVKFFRNQVITYLVSSVLGIITSAILFNSMSLLYFEEFRRDIFIKRISGMKFFELHDSYLIMQFAILIFGVGISLLATKNFGTSIITLAIFAVNMLLILTYQMRKENSMAVTVLKGM